ncbi:MAG: NUDIX hydrolase [Comamonadaceae bacterium]|nr:NUDIX hydrolase [Burkholderiales bacterium]MEB2347881.1 NUDIX hydrolase [Comamonadaceae bacterium]
MPSGAFHRWKPHVTVAAVIERDGQFLLIEEHTSDGLKLNNPAGHLEPGETPEQGCAREVLEEAAYDFEPQALVGVYLNRFIKTRTGEDLTYLRFAYSGRLGAHHGWRQLDTGIVRTLWMSSDEIRACRERHRSPLLLASLEDYLAGRRYPLALVHTDASVPGCAVAPR